MGSSSGAQHIHYAVYNRFCYAASLLRESVSEWRRDALTREYVRRGIMV